METQMVKKNPKSANDFSSDIFIEKYAMKEVGEDRKTVKTIETDVKQAFIRNSKALAEKYYTNLSSGAKPTEDAIKNIEEEFLSCFLERRGILAGRALIALGNTMANLTAMNCFVVPVDDSIDGILGENFLSASKIQQAGGGFGANFSNIRPFGTPVKGVTSTASGPVSFMNTWDSMIATMRSAGQRRGAGMAILDIDHPDVLEFITAKQNSKLTNFNVSVAVTNEFVEALKTDKEYELKHNGRSYGKLKASLVFDKIVENAYNYNEPGFYFKDKTNEWSNGWYYQKLNSTNPCGEIPLPSWGCCDLGMVILPTFVIAPFESKEIDYTSLQATVKTLVRMLDTVLDTTYYPVEQTKKVAMQDRRLGLGITGLADMLAMLKIKYDSDEAIAVVDSIMRTIRDAAYETSIELAKLKGPFPKYNKEKFLQGKFIQSLPEHLQKDIEKYGMRNVYVMTCQPAGTISLLLNNVSSGIEPIFSLKMKRRMRDERGDLTRTVELYDHAYKSYKDRGFDKIYGEKPDFFQTTKSVTLEGHYKMQNKIQQYVDNSISKTINFPEDTDFDSFKKFMYNVVTSNNYVKGMTTFRDGTIASILTDEDERPELREDQYRKRSFTYQIKRTSGLPSVHVHVTYVKNYIAQVFVDTRDIDFYKQMLPYFRLLSIMFEREKNLEQILEILQELEDMDYVEMEEQFSYKGKPYNNFLAAVKECIWDCLIELGLIKDEADEETEDYKDTACPKGVCEL